MKMDDPMEKYREMASAFVVEAVASLYGRKLDVAFSTQGEFADFEFPCFQLSKELKKDPGEIAEEIASQHPPPELTVQAMRGYVNINANRNMLARETVGTVLHLRESYGRYTDEQERILIEHTSVNPNGPIHVGRARNAVIGDTLVRCMRQAGHRVQSEYYVNDVGRQVVILLWGIKRLMCGPVEGKIDHALVRYYIQANELMEKDSAVEEEIKEMQRKIEAGDEELLSEARQTAEKVLGGIRESLAALNIDYDSFAFESDFIRNGDVRQTIERMKRLPVAAEEGGAWYIPFDGEKFYFTRSDGTSLYTARDIAYHINKFRRADRLINVLGEDQKLGASYLTRTLELLGEKRRIDFLFHSFVSLEEGRMSTRQGRTVLLDDVTREAKEKAREEVLKRRVDIEEGEVESIAEAVGKGAVRFNIARLQAEKKLIFKWSDALNFEGNSAPFVQYSHARACSILRKAGEWSEVREPLFEEEEELRLAKELALFPGVLREISETLAVHRLPLYAQQLAAEFNQFYRVVPVLRADEMRRSSRLMLVECTRIVLRNALNCMGIAAPERM